jgi:glycosyltransferase involved in cell wall biosynthesis
LISSMSISNRGSGGLATSAPWVIVAGGFHELGGMDKANAALAEFLLDRGTAVHLVAHRGGVSPALASRAGVTVHHVPLPVHSFLLGGPLLDRRGRAVARAVSAMHPDARVVVNGGNCAWSDVNWVHSVHEVWPCVDDGAPMWFKVKNRVTKRLARRQESRVLHGARVVIANSERTRRDLLEQLRLPAHRVHTVYLGSDASGGPPSPDERARARQWLGVSPDRPLVAHVGAIGYDRNKGFDLLWSAWRRLQAQGEWGVDLVVAGTGGAERFWRAEIARAGLADHVRLLGFTPRVRDVLAAADLLVSPVRYEAYGLNVHEAICRGIPVIVSAQAGVAELFPAELRDLLLRDPEDVTELADRLVRWRANPERWNERFAALGARLRSYRWHDMARDIVATVETSPS